MALSPPAPRPAFATRMSRHALPSRPHLEQAPDLVRVGDVGRHRPRVAPLRHDPVGYAVHLAGRACGADDERPFPAIGEGDRFADTTARAGHEGDFSFQTVHRVRDIPYASDSADSTIRSSGRLVGAPPNRTLS